MIGTITGAGVINTTTSLTDAYNGENIRGVVSTDGTQFWTAGQPGDVTSGFVHYTQLGDDGPSTFITGPTGPSNIDTVEIFNGQLYEGVRNGSKATERHLPDRHWPADDQRPGADFVHPGPAVQSARRP